MVLILGIRFLQTIHALKRLKLLRTKLLALRVCCGNAILTFVYEDSQFRGESQTISSIVLANTQNANPRLFNRSSVPVIVFVQIPTYTWSSWEYILIAVQYTGGGSKPNGDQPRRARRDINQAELRLSSHHIVSPSNRIRHFVHKGKKHISRK